MNLKQLPYFVAIAQTGSLSAAAAQLHVSQPALSSYLRELRAELGVELFFSCRRQLYLTPAGEIYLKGVRRILELQAQAQASIQMLQQGAHGQLRIGVTPHRGAKLLAELYPLFSKCFARTELVIREGYADDLLRFVQQDEVDFSVSTFLNTGGEPAGLDYLPIFEEEVLLSVPVFISLPGAVPAPDGRWPIVDLADCRDLPFVLMSESTTVGALARIAFREAGYKPVVVYQSSNVLFVDAMIRSGAGAGLIPASYAVPSGEVNYYRLKSHPPFRTCCIRRCDRPYSEQAQYMIYLILQNSAGKPNCRLCFNDFLRGLVDAYDGMPPLPAGWEGSARGH